jgi:hypothetical protein
VNCALIEELNPDKLTKGWERQGYPFGNDFHQWLSGLLQKRGIQFVNHPNGSQNFPDIHTSEGVEIETKSSKSGKIMWNSGIPTVDGVYVWGSYQRRDSRVYVFPGSAVITEAVYKQLKDFEKNLRQQAASTTEYIRSIGIPWQIYPRCNFNDLIDKEWLWINGYRLLQEKQDTKENNQCDT